MARIACSHFMPSLLVPMRQQRSHCRFCMNIIEFHLVPIPQNHKTLAPQPRIVRQWKRNGQNLSTPQMSAMADQLLHLSNPTDTLLQQSLMLSFAHHQLFSHFHSVWDQFLNSSSLPSIKTLTTLFRSLSTSQNPSLISHLLSQLASRRPSASPRYLREAFSAALTCLADAGNLQLMETTVRTMASEGLSVGASTANAYVRCHSLHGSLSEMENAYQRLKRSRFCIDRESIRAVGFAYLKNKKLYKLGEFAREVGLGRRDVGNLVWNLLLLSYAASFKMKSLQREFVRMIECGFRPDLTTFNLRAMAFSRMSLWWDLHLCLQHMKHLLVSPDIVTYGCVVDLYLEKRRGRNLGFALNAMEGFQEDYPVLLTDPLVFQVLGKGDFHLSSEAFMEFSNRKDWTYRKLIHVYTKKYYRRNQVFWNY